MAAECKSISVNYVRARAFVAEKLYLIRREEGRIDRVYDVVELAICYSMEPEWKVFSAITRLGTNTSPDKKYSKLDFDVVFVTK